MIKSCPDGPIFEYLLAEAQGRPQRKEELRKYAEHVREAGVLVSSYGPIIYSREELWNIQELFVEPTRETDFPDEVENWDAEDKSS